MTDNKLKQTEELLFNYKNTLVEIENLKIDLEILKNDYKGASAVTYGERTAPTNAFNSSVENEVIAREKRISHLENLIKFKQKGIEKINNMLGSLKERDKYLITQYYINGEQLKKISSEIGLNETYASTYKNGLVANVANLIFTKETP